jgi:hypothetical protein
VRARGRRVPCRSPAGRARGRIRRDDAGTGSTGASSPKEFGPHDRRGRLRRTGIQHRRAPAPRCTRRSSAGHPRPGARDLPV